MGHGASTNVKRVSIHNVDIVTTLEPPRTNSMNRGSPNRSASDGSTLATYNSSKNKLGKHQELLRSTESKYEESKDTARILEKQLAEIEGTNFELSDRVNELEQQLEALRTDDASQPEGEQIKCLEQQLYTKDQCIEALEVQVKALEAEMKKVRLKCKKRLKAAQTETAEARQEASLKVYSLKDDIKRLEEENIKLIARLDRASSARKSHQGPAEIPKSIKKPDEEDMLDGWEDGRTKLIVELSKQVSAQEEHISYMEKQLTEKDAMIRELQASSGEPNTCPTSGQPKNVSAKLCGRTTQKSHWGYPAELACNTEEVKINQQWAANNVEISTKPKKVLNREGGNRQYSARSRRRMKETLNDSDPEVSASCLTNQSHWSKTESANKSSRNSSAVSCDSTISNSNGEINNQTLTSAVSSRQRRYLKVTLDESSKYSPCNADTALSDLNILSRTTDEKDSGIDIDRPMSNMAEFPLIDSNR